MAKFDKTKEGELEAAMSRPLTDLEKEILGLIENHHEHILGLAKRVQALETMVGTLARASVVLPSREH